MIAEKMQMVYNYLEIFCLCLIEKSIDNISKKEYYIRGDRLMFDVEYYELVVDNKIILTNGFVKKTQKTPPGEIALAMKYKADYEGRQKKK